ncbi:MAG: nucleotidyltransferase domain-containing protein, partial [Lachnospiraceae bacterium]|nr:nucleotidyltransferase domain-containing protein [Lachnospiraceae bacterium]
MGKYGDIAETLFHYYQVLMRHYPEDSIMGVFLYGSQNYNFDTPTSDIDAKAIYIPTYEEMVNLKEPVSRVYGTDYGNVEVKDIRLMWKMWKKQNINFVEILFTDYYLTNKNYTNLWEY